MLAIDILRQAVQGEVKQIALSDIGSDGSRTVTQEANFQTLLGFLNQGIIEIYKKFPQITTELVFDIIVGKYEYGLPANFRQPLFATTDTGIEIPLNRDRDDTFSLLFPTPYTMMVKGTVPTEPNPAKKFSLVYTTFSTLVQDDYSMVEVSPVFLDPLLAFIGYKAFASMAGDRRQQENSFYSKFLNSCEEIKLLGLDNLHTDVYNEKFNNRGFV